MKRGVCVDASFFYAKTCDNSTGYKIRCLIINCLFVCALAAICMLFVFCRKYLTLVNLMIE